MSSDKGRKGRPARDAAETAGRDRIIKAAQQSMRSRQLIDLPRRDLATAAGVTPGLVTYYFPEDMDLVEASVRPIMQGYLTRLAAICSASADPREALRSLVLLFLEIARDNGQLLETYIDFAKQRPTATAAGILASATGDFTVLLQACQRDGVLTLRNNAFHQTVLWGICKTVAQSQELGVILLAETPDGDLADLQAGLIMDLIAPRGPRPG